MSGQTTAPVDVDRILDSGAWSVRQKSYVLLIALAVIIDGFDNQVLGLTIPALAAEWSVPRTNFATALAASLFGLACGTVISGWLGDRIGRRLVLIGAVLLFGVMTIAIIFTGNVAELSMARFVAGLGLGGAMPNATALLAEFTPRRRQMWAVALGITCIPLGGLCAAYLSSYVIPTLGWKAMYVLGGTATLLVAMLLIFLLPESPRFLAADPRRWPLLANTLNRILGQARFDTDTSYRAVSLSTGAPFTVIFGDKYRRDTMALWASYFFNLFAVYVYFNWIPTMLTVLGVPPASVGTGAALFNMGGVAGAMAGVWLIDRFGSRRVMASFCIGAIIGGLALGFIKDRALFFAVLTIVGVGIVGGQTLLYAIAAQIYETSVRSTGIGSALTVGRFGAIASSFVGAAALQMDTSGSAFFLMTAATMTLTLVSVLAISSRQSRIHACEEK